MKVSKLDKKQGIGIAISGNEEEMKWFEKEIIERGKIGEISCKVGNIESKCSAEDVKGGNGEPIVYVINGGEKPVKVCMEGETVTWENANIGIGGNGKCGIYKIEDLKNG